jgi:hypothetical protein
MSDPRLPYGLPWYCEDASELEQRGEEEDARLDFESQWASHSSCRVGEK